MESNFQYNSGLISTIDEIEKNFVLGHALAAPGGMPIKAMENSRPL